MNARLIYNCTRESLGLEVEERPQFADWPTRADGAPSICAIQLLACQFEKASRICVAVQPCSTPASLSDAPLFACNLHGDSAGV